MEEKKVSIILPVYNTSANLLHTCIYSIIHQTYSNIEIVIIDDGSNNKETINEYNMFAKGDARIKVIVQKNSGVSVARDKGIQCACGEFIMFCDSDDMMHPKACEVLIQLMQEGEFELAESAILEVASLEKIDCSDHKGSYKKKVIHSNQLLMEKLIESSTMPLGWSLWGKIFKTEILKKYCNAYRGICRGEDVLILAEYVMHIQHYICSNQVLYFYNKGNPNSATKSVNLLQNITICHYGKGMVDIYKGSGSKKGYLYAKANYCGLLFGGLLQCMYYKIENHRAIEKQIKREMWKYSGELIWNPYIHARMKNIIALLCPQIFVIFRKMRSS